MGNYDDIIGLPHHESAKHPKMPALDRAAQFMPFAALTGHNAAVMETERLLIRRITRKDGTGRNEKGRAE